MYYNALFYLIEYDTWKAILHQNHFGFLFRTSLKIEQNVSRACP